MSITFEINTIMILALRFSHSKMLYKKEGHFINWSI